ncbi:tubulin binding cofactor A [Panus rudis PR-1116 ss-1]|nr:tubulin binding cofactor A [Panus rudis PR-1116 ss-1]
MSEKAEIQRKIKIKTGSVKRLHKEHLSYQKEEEDLKRKLEKFLADGAEDWDIKNTRKMMEESAKMSKDTANRLGSAVQDLRELIVGLDQNEEWADDENLVKAKEALEEVSV